MTIDDLRKQVVQCRTLEEMRTVWETLRSLGEVMYTNNFCYIKAQNIDWWACLWMSSTSKPTLSYSDFMTEFGSKQDIDWDFLRKQVVGNFQSLDEMREAWELLKSVGEKMIQHKFLYQTIYNLNRLNNTWRTTERSATMSLQELKNFISCPSAPIEEGTKNEPECNCKSLFYGHSLGCYYFKER